MSGFFTMLKRELKAITKEKTIMFAIFVQFFIASFSSIILVGIMAFYDPTSIGDSTQVTVKAGVVGDSQSPMLGYLKDSNIAARQYPDMAAAEAAFRRGRIDTIMFLPESRGGVVDMKITMPELDTKKTVIFMVLDEPLKRYENYLREANGVELYYNDTGGKSHTSYEFLYSLIVPILMLFPALIAGSIVIDTVTEEFENKTFDTLASAPVSLGQVFTSKIATAVIMAVIQMVLWVGLLRLNNIAIQSPVLVVLLAVIIAATVSVGTAIMALYFKDRERTQFVYSIVLVAVIGGSYFLNPSPFSLITGLAAGAPNLGIFEIALYAIPLVILGLVFHKVSRRVRL